MCTVVFRMKCSDSIWLTASENRGGWGSIKWQDLQLFLSEFFLVNFFSFIDELGI